MEQNGWNTDHDFPDPPRRGPRSSPVLHGRGMNTPNIRVRASPSAQEGSYKSAAPVEFQGTGDIVEDVIRALRRRPAAPEAVRDVMGVYGTHMGKYDVIATVTALQKRHDWRRCFHVSRALSWWADWGRRIAGGQVRWRLMPVCFRDLVAV